MFIDLQATRGILAALFIYKRLKSLIHKKFRFFTIKGGGRVREEGG